MSKNSSGQIETLSQESWDHVNASRDALLKGPMLVRERDIDSEESIELMESIEAGVLNSLTALGFNKASVIWSDSPTATLETAYNLLDEDIKKAESKRDITLKLSRHSITWGWRFAWISHWLIVDELEEIKSAPEKIRSESESWRDALMSPFWVNLESEDADGQVVITALLSKPHVRLSLDDNGALHCADGPAWEWADGTAIYALEGVQIPSWVVDPKARTVEKILGLENTEQRRVAAANHGWEEIVSDWKVLDSNPDPRMGTLYEVPELFWDAEFRDEGLSASFLLVQNSSKHPNGEYKMYGLFAAAGVKSVAEAQASLAGTSVEDYEALIQGSS